MPLIGAQGPGSNISWRGNLDEYPDEFNFPEVIDVLPGDPGISTSQTITGINYKTGVTAVGSACSVRVTPYNDETQTYGTPTDFLPAPEDNPVIIRNNDKVELQILTEEASGRNDYNRVYPTTITIGTRPSVEWSVTTYPLDDIPDPFSFNGLTNLETNTLTVSNTVTVTGIDDVIGVDIFIVSTTGELSINGGPFGSTGKIFDGDTLQLRNTTTNTYSTSLVTTVQLGNTTEDFIIVTRAADTTVNDFSFTSVTDVDVNTFHESNTITISGADENVNGNNPLPISITGGQYRIVRDGQVIQDYTDQSGETQNGDEITLKVQAPSSYTSTQTASVTISQLTRNFSATTRERPIDTIPDQFTFTDQIDVNRNKTITSNTITLSGMTDFGDEGTATISSASEVNAKFKVVRGGITVRDYSSASFGVRNGDQITLQLTSSPNSLGAVSATFTIAGLNTFNVLSGVNGSTSDTWNVTSAQRFCTITDFNLTNRTGDSGELNPGQLASTSFIATGFDEDCGMTVSTSNANSYLKIGSRQGTSLSNVQIDDVVEVYMTTPYYDQTRTTTVTLTSSFGTSRSKNWTIGPVSPPPPELTLDAQARSVPFVFPDGGTAVLTYTYNYVTQSSVTATGPGFNLSSISPNTLSSGAKSGTYVVGNLQNGSNDFSLRVSNSSGSVTDNVTVLVGTPPPPTVTLCPSDTSTCSSTSTKNKGDNIRLYWKTTNTVTTESPDFNTGGNQNGNVLISNLQQDNKTFTVRATGAGTNPVTVQAQHTVDLRPAVSISASSTNINTGQSITLTWSSDFATSVVNTSGQGFSTNQLNGSTTVTPPKGNVTYGITVRDSIGLESSASVTITVTDDVTVDSFSMSPSSVNNVNRSSNHESEPRWGGSGTTVRGLSPGVSVTARVTNGVFTSGGTTKTVSNGTSSSSLRIRVTASGSYSTAKTATLNINGVSATFKVTTESCVVFNSTDSHDGLSFNTRRCYASGGFNQVCFRNIRSGSGNIGRAGNGQSGSATWAPGSHSWSVPAGVYSVTGSVIGGGGAGGWHRSQAGAGGGGGGAHRKSWNCSPGQGFSIRVGSGGSGGRDNRTDGQGSDIRGAGNSVSAGGGERGGGDAGGAGGSGGTANGARGGNRRGEGASSEGGHGGGAGRVTGGTCQSGSTCGGEGGNGGPGQGSNLGGSCTGNNCRKGAQEGANGNAYGGAGSGGAQGNGGGSGGQGRARLQWTISYPNYSKQSVVKKIADAYWSKGRPPTVGEIRSWYNAFRDRPASYPTLDNLYSSIRGSIGSWSGATDNCGNAFPQSY